MTIVNRTFKPARALKARWDGKTIEIPPGKSSQPAIIALAAKMQNPILGSDDPMTGELQYLIGVEEVGDDCTPIEQSNEIELYNRKNLGNAVPVMIVSGNTGLYSVKRDLGTSLPLDSTFVPAG